MVGKKQTIVITINGPKNVGDNIDYSEKLEAAFGDCNKIMLLETKNTTNRDYDLRIASENGTFEDFAPRTSYMAQVTSGASTQFLPIKFEDRKHDVVIPGGTKVIFGVKHTEAMLAGEQIVIKALMYLNKK